MQVAQTSGATASAKDSTLTKLASWLDQHAIWIVAVLMVGYTIGYTWASIAKYNVYAMGFDLAFMQQQIWNTAHGRLFESSVFSFTNNALGVDLQLIELPIAFFYALAPSVYTMLLVQSAALALGALPVFLLTRDRLGWALAGVGLALAYLFYPVVTNTNLYEFRLRSFAVAPFLFALYFLFRQRLWLYYLSLFIALLCRTDMGFTVAMIGLYALWQRKAWAYVIPPVIVGAAWVGLSVFVVVPRLSNGHAYLFGSIYGWLGNTPTEMVTTIVTRPLYVLENVVTAGKLGFLNGLFAPLAYLPLLNPAALLIAAPTLALNLLSPSGLHWDIIHGYSIHIVPFVFLAAIQAIRWLTERLKFPNVQPRQLTAGLVGLALAATFLVNLSWGNPAARWVVGRHAAPSPRVSLIRDVASAVPPDAGLATTSLVAPILPPRRLLYYFPGNQLYDPSSIEQAAYILVDTKGANDETMNLLAAYRGKPEWGVATDRDGVILLARRSP